MAAVRGYCDRAVLIEDGKVSYDGSPEDTAEKYFQLFSNKQEDVVENKQLTIDSVETDISRSRITFKIDVKNNSDKKIQNVLLRIAVKKQNGRNVAGFDNKNLDNPFEIDFLPNEHKTLYFEAENILGNGDFSINSSLSSDGAVNLIDEEDEEGDGDSVGMIVYDIKPKIASFSVKKPGLNAPVVLPAKAKKNKAGNE